MSDSLTTIDELIEALGGTSVVSSWLGVGSSAVSNWRARNELPGGWHLRIYLEAVKRGLSIDPQLFGMSAATDVAAADTQLGRQTALPVSPDQAQLDRVPNPHADMHFVARFTQPEFTSLCPVTGQPDFAHLVIDYVPDKWLVESKSLKLYLASFRNHGAFHEDCTVAIGKRIAALLEPHYLRIGGYWYPRGGMPIDVFWQTGVCPKDVWLPDQGVAPYRGRG